MAKPHCLVTLWEEGGERVDDPAEVESTLQGEWSHLPPCLLEPHPAACRLAGTLLQLKLLEACSMPA